LPPAANEITIAMAAAKPHRCTREMECRMSPRLSRQVAVRQGENEGARGFRRRGVVSRSYIVVNNRRGRLRLALDGCRRDNASGASPVSDLRHDPVHLLLELRSRTLTDQNPNWREPMKPKMRTRRAIYALAAVMVMAYVAPTYAQTQGMDRRNERRDDRAGARAEKQACKAGDEKTRAECRQVKRDTKQQGRNDGGAPGTKPAQ